MHLPAEWREFISLLSAHGVRYVVVGAHALAAHGRPRATGDIDFWVEPSRDNAERLCAALGEFGFTGLAQQVDEFSTIERMATLGVPPLRIDVMTSVDGVQFAEAWAGRLTALVDGQEMQFLGLAELRTNKVASGRPKDLADVALIDELIEASRDT
jgi:Nucleotidyl transferase of unknown function (DUF2204)